MLFELQFLQFKHVKLRRRMPTFKQYMTSSTWPPDKPKGAVYILTQRNRLPSLSELLKSFDEFYNDEFKYPVIIFYEVDCRTIEPMTVRSMTNSSVFFQQVVFELPDFVDKSKVPRRAICHHMHKVGYRHMCRFHAKTVFDMEIVKGLSYIWRLDDDSLLTRPIRYDLFRYMNEHNILYGYHFISRESWQCVEGLWETADKYIASKAVDVTNAYISWNRSTIYYNNFEISDVSVWSSGPYQKFVDHIDRTGNIFYIRWGDAPMKTIAVNLFIPTDKVHHFKDVGYLHGEDFENQ